MLKVHISHDSAIPAHSREVYRLQIRAAEGKRERGIGKMPIISFPCMHIRVHFFTNPPYIATFNRKFSHLQPCCKFIPVL